MPGAPRPIDALHVAIVTDAWPPQVNGVVRTLAATGGELLPLGHPVTFLTPLDFPTLPCPTYPQIRLALLPRRPVARLLDAAPPTPLHLAPQRPIPHTPPPPSPAHG